MLIIDNLIADVELLGDVWSRFYESSFVNFRFGVSRELRGKMKQKATASFTFDLRSFRHFGEFEKEVGTDRFMGGDWCR